MNKIFLCGDKVEFTKEEKDIGYLSLRRAGCKCESPLLGYRPDVGYRCRLCNVVSDKELDIVFELKARSQQVWVTDNDLMTNTLCRLAANHIIKLGRP